MVERSGRFRPSAPPDMLCPHEQYQADRDHNDTKNRILTTSFPFVALWVSRHNGVGVRPSIDRDVVVTVASVDRRHVSWVRYLQP